MESPWILPAPQILNEPDQWGENAIKSALFYAHCRLKSRKVTPRTEAFLQQYQEIANAALNDPTLAKRSVLAEFTKTLRSKVILQKDASLRDIQGQVILKKLVVMRYLADYGDYLSEQCKRFRDAAAEEKIDGYEHFTGDGKSWTTVQNNLNNEEKLYNLWKKRVQFVVGSIDRHPLPDDPTTQAIHRACIALDLDYENTRYSIERYADRNQTMHCMVGVWIKDSNWTALGAQLQKDLRDLPNVMGGQEQSQMRLVLESISERYFDRLGPKCIPSELAESLQLEQNRKRRLKLRSSDELRRDQQEKTKLATAIRAERKSQMVIPVDEKKVAARHEKKSSSSSWVASEEDFELGDFM